MWRETGRHPTGGNRLLWVIVSGCALTFVAIAVQDRVPVGHLTRDLASTTESAWYHGSVSAIGALGWATAAAVAGFALALLTSTAPGSRDRLSLLLATVLSVVLALDDLLILHDDVLLRLLGSELPVYGAYAALAGTWLAVSRRSITRPVVPALTVAIVALSGSVAIDVLWVSETDLRLLAEDGLKFLGIWTWATFIVLHSLSVLRRELRPGC